MCSDDLAREPDQIAYLFTVEVGVQEKLFSLLDSEMSHVPPKGIPFLVFELSPQSST
jgi:hypothetical protein